MAMGKRRNVAVTRDKVCASSALATLPGIEATMKSVEGASNVGEETPLAVAKELFSGARSLQPAPEGRAPDA